MEPSAPSLAVIITVFVTGTVILMCDSHLPPLPVWAPISPVGPDFEDVLWLGGWVPLSGVVPELGPTHSFTHLVAWSWGHS